MRRVVRMIVEAQVTYGSPPATKKALRRLLKKGVGRAEAVERIVTAVRRDVWRVLQGAPFDPARYEFLLEHVE
jgi:hypothetical protein